MDGKSLTMALSRSLHYSGISIRVLYVLPVLFVLSLTERITYSQADIIVVCLGERG